MATNSISGVAQAGLASTASMVCVNQFVFSVDHRNVVEGRTLQTHRSSIDLVSAIVKKGGAHTGSADINPQHGLVSFPPSQRQFEVMAPILREHHPARCSSGDKDLCARSTRDEMLIRSCRKNDLRVRCQNRISNIS